MPSAPSRRSVVTAAGLALGAATLGACGTDPDPGSGAGAADEVASVHSTPATDPFPLTVRHQFGETVVAADPQRVVVVGITEQDVLLELGVVPIATTEWYGEQPHATWPWAQDLLGDAEPTVLDATDGIPYEQVVGLRPDLIVATNAGITEKDYDLLADIAPTVTSVEGSTQYFSSWQDQTLQIARALGREEDGQVLIDDVTAQYAKVAQEHPEWEGLTATFSQGEPYDGQLYVYPAGLSTDFLTDLGFEITPGLDSYAPDKGSQAQISAENVNLIDADVIVFATEDATMLDTLLDFATVPTLDAVKENRAVYTDGILAGAIYFDTPLSLTYVLDRLTPLLDKAVDGASPQEVPAA